MKGSASPGGRLWRATLNCRLQWETGTKGAQAQTVSQSLALRCAPPPFSSDDGPTDLQGKEVMRNKVSHCS